MTMALNMEMMQSTSSVTALGALMDSLQYEANGVAADFTLDAPGLLIRDTSTPSNNFDGRFNDKASGGWGSPKVIGQIDDREYVRNQTMAGVVAGTPGTAPTNWVALGTPAGVTRQIVGTGVENGITYVEVRFSGTIGATSGIVLDFDGSIPATTQQRWRISALLSVVGGTLASLNDVYFSVREGDDANTLVTPNATNAHRAATIGNQLSSSLTAFSADVETTGGAATRLVTPRFMFYSTAGGPVDITFRVGLPSFKRLDVVYDHAPHNYIRNNAMLGAVPGTPGTLPTGWTVAGSDGSLTRTIVGTGGENGFEYIDIRYSGTAASSTSIGVATGDPAHAPALSGQSWTFSTYFALVGGSAANLTSISVLIGEWTNVNAFVTGGTSLNLPLSGLPTSLQRYSLSRTLSGGATTARTGGLITFGFSVGAVVDITVRIARPQLEHRRWAGTPIRTTNAARFPVFPEYLTSRNEIRNNTMVGAAAGSPGTLPTNWGVTNLGTLTQTLAVGVENGIEYLEVRLNGTTSTTGTVINIEPRSQIVAANGQTWTHASFLSIVGGSLTNITAVKVRIDENTAAGAYVADGTTDFDTSLTATLQRFSHTRTLSGGGTVARVSPHIVVEFSSGVAIDITLRIGLPQLERQSFATDPIRTTGLARNGNTVLGALIEGARTNEIRNNSMQGAVAGTPGTLPTNWNIGGSGLGTLTRTIVGTGVENGIEYVDIRFNGTTSTTDLAIQFESTTQIVAATAQVWSFSAFVSIVAGSATNVTSIVPLMYERTSIGTLVTGANGTNFLSSVTNILQRFSQAITLAGGGTVARVQPSLAVNFSSGVAIDITLRIGWPQMEQAAFASSPIRTTSAAVTRAADDIYMLTSALPSFSSGGYMVVRYIPGQISQVPAVIAFRQDANNLTRIAQASGGSAKEGVNVFGGVNTANVTPTGTLAVGSRTTIAYSFAPNSHRGASDGGIISSVATGPSLPTYSVFRFGFVTSAANDYLHGHLQWAKIVPRTTLTDAQVVSESALT